MWTIIIAFLIYHIICTIVLLVTESINIDNEDILVFLCTGFITLPIWLVVTIYKKIKQYIRYRKGIFLAQKIKQDNGNDYIPVIVPYKYIEHFENSNYWRIYKRYPDKQELYSGYTYKKNNETIIQTYDIPRIKPDDLDEVLNERNCFHCKHNGIECNEDDCLCTNDIYGKIIEYDKYNKITKK